MMLATGLDPARKDEGTLNARQYPLNFTLMCSSKFYRLASKSSAQGVLNTQLLMNFDQQDRREELSAEDMKYLEEPYKAMKIMMCI